MRTIRWARIAPPGQLVHVGARELTRGARVEHHGHDFAELFWVRDGRGAHHIGTARFPLEENDLSAVLPTDVHAIRAKPGQGLSLVNVAFEAGTLAFILKRYCRRTRGPWGRGGAPLRLTEAQRRWLDSFVQGLARRADSRLELDRFLLTLLSETGGAEADHHLSAGPDWLRAACDRLGEERAFAGGVRALARLARRSPEHLARTLKRTTGLTPIEVVTRARMAHAATHLRLSARAITDIAMDCGYGSLSHFYAVFKRTFGSSPHKYRREHQATLSPPR
jgi:AraC family cel operon transcriptional repressor